MATNKEVLSKILKAYRALRGLTQEQIAAKLSMTGATYVSKESGRSEFSALEAAKLCQIFGVKFEDIFLLGNSENIIVRPMPGTEGHGFEVDVKEG